MMFQSERAAIEEPAAVDPPSGTPENGLSAVVPRQDALAAQGLLCRTLSTLTATRRADESYFRAVLALDRHAKPIADGLLDAYVEGDGQARPLDPRYLISARLMSRAFVHACERLLQNLADPIADDSRTIAASVLARLFRHRHVEFLLRLLRYKKRNSEQWRQLCRPYRFAQRNALEHERVFSIDDPASIGEVTPHQRFIEILLLGALNTGQFSPRELVWSTRHIARWSRLLVLQPLLEREAASDELSGFVVDLHGSEGLERSRHGAKADLHLDTTPLICAIDAQIEALGATPADGQAQAASRPDGGVALLSKLRIAFSPQPVHITRRGERRLLTSSVQTVAGLKHIVQIVRDRARNATPVIATPAEEITLSRSPNTVAPLTLPPAVSPMAMTVSGTRTPKSWQVKDWSDSGCRLRGRTGDLNEVVPGALICVREHDNHDWIIAIVRRLRRLMVDHVEISLEFIGQRPRFVKLVESTGRTVSGSDIAHIGRKRFGALYLPVSEQRPTMPVRSLLVPVNSFQPGQVARLVSSTVTYALRFNNPFEEHADFVWTTFTLIEKVEPKPALAKAH